MTRVFYWWAHGAGRQKERLEGLRSLCDGARVVTSPGPAKPRTNVAGAMGMPPVSWEWLDLAKHARSSAA